MRGARLLLVGLTGAVLGAGAGAGATGPVTPHGVKVVKPRVLRIRLTAPDGAPAAFRAYADGGTLWTFAPGPPIPGHWAACPDARLVALLERARNTRG
jgi:phage tail protein X